MQRHKLNLDMLLQHAVNCYNDGQMQAAMKTCEKLLAMEPESADPLHSLGLVAYQHKDLDTAIALFCRAVQLAPDQSTYYLNLGQTYKDKGMHQQAMVCYQRAVELNPDSVEGLLKIGVIEYHCGNIDRSIACLHKVLNLQPAFTAVHILMGDLLQDQGQADDALSHYQTAQKLEPLSADLFYKIGKIYQHQKKFSNAQTNFQRALELNPELPDALFHLAVVHDNQGEWEMAQNYYLKLLKIVPDSAETLYNLAGTMTRRGRFEDAVRYLQNSLRIKPDNADTYNNLGLNLKSLGKIDEATDQFRKAIKIEPTLAHVHLNLAISLLSVGDFSEGWREYDWRFDVDAYKSDYRYRDKQIWNGKPFKDKCLLVHDDQGIGDTLQFVRYLPRIKKMGGTVIMETRRELLPLLADFAGIDLLVERPPQGPLNIDFDYYIPLMSIPGRMGTASDNIPSGIPYLSSEREKRAFWKDKLKKPSFKIGLVWAGNPLHVNDAKRSCSLDQFEWLGDIRHISLVCLQKTITPAEDKSLGNLGIEYFGAQLNDFSDTAAIVANLDLVLTVDTAVAHLAGAMGQSTWILLPFDADWRWMTTRSDSLWYPTARLFRQHRPGDWNGVMTDVRCALRARVQQFCETAG